MTSTPSMKLIGPDGQPILMGRETGTFVMGQAMTKPSAVVSQPESLMQVIVRAATDPTFDAEKFQLLVNTYKATEQERAREEFNKAMAACQKDLPLVVKNAANTQTNSRYATLDQVVRAIMPIVAKHGISVTFDSEVLPDKSALRIIATVAYGGHERPYHVDMPVDLAGIQGTKNKTPTHAFGSTISYGRRYLLLMIFNVGTADDDDGNAGGGVASSPAITQEQLHDLDSRIQKVGPGFIDAFLKHFKVDSLASLPAKEYDRAIAAIKKKEEAIKGPAK